MGIVCAKCGKTVEGEGLSFCPYCGERLPEEKQQPSVRNEEAEKWIRKAQEKTSYPERKKILLKGKEACPDSPEIDCHESVNVLNLVDGQRCLVESVDGSFSPYEVHYAETFIVPECAGKYRLRTVEGPVKVMQAYLRC